MNRNFCLAAFAVGLIAVCWVGVGYMASHPLAFSMTLIIGVVYCAGALELLRSQAVDVEYWPTMDPSTVAGNREQVLDAYRQTRDRLEERIRRRFG